MKITNGRLLSILILFVGVILPASATLADKPALKIRVEVIQADRASTVVDPKLKDLVKELGPVLNFTGFTLLKKAVIPLDVGKTGEVALPSDRLLKLEFLGFEKDKAKLKVVIIEKGKETFSTIVLLVNKGSVLIGGPPQKQGVLLLRIKGEFK